MWLVDTNI